MIADRFICLSDIQVTFKQTVDNYNNDIQTYTSSLRCHQLGDANWSYITEHLNVLTRLYEVVTPRHQLVHPPIGLECQAGCLIEFPTYQQNPWQLSQSSAIGDALRIQIYNPLLMTWEE